VVECLPSKCEVLSSNPITAKKKPGVGIHSCNPSYLRSIGSKSALGKKYETLLKKCVAQVVECLPSQHEALNSNPNTITKKVAGVFAGLCAVLFSLR
jgi:hypothetical protein